jgi:hypothetical protein
VAQYEMNLRDYWLDRRRRMIIIARRCWSRC